MTLSTKVLLSVPTSQPPAVRTISISSLTFPSFNFHGRIFLTSLTINGTHIIHLLAFLDLLTLGWGTTGAIDFCSDDGYLLYNCR